MATTPAAARPTPRPRRRVLSGLAFAWVGAAVRVDVIMVEAVDGGR